MSDTLLIRLESASDGTASASWLVCDADGALVVAMQSGALSAAAANAVVGRRVIVLVHGTDILQTQAELPAKAGAKLAQAVPFALEEQLADDVETLHFAIGERTDSGSTRVSVVARTKLEAWTRALALASIRPDALFADNSLMPCNPGQIVLLIDGVDAHICTPDGRRTTLPVEGLADSLELATVASSTTGAALDVAVAAPTGLLVHATPTDWQAHSAQVEAMRSRFEGVKVQLLPQGLLPWLARQLSSVRPINLLQGAFASRRTSSGGLARWRLAAALLAGFLVLHAGSQFWQLSRVARQERALETQLADALRPVFPNDNSTRDARRRVQRELERVRGGNNSGSFLPALSALAAARQSAPDSRVETVSFAREGIDARILAGTAESLERMRSALSTSGWDAEVQGESSQGKEYSGRLRIRAPGGVATRSGS